MKPLKIISVVFVFSVICTLLIPGLRNAVIDKFADRERKEENEGEGKMAPYDYLEMVRNYPDFALDMRAYHQAVAECNRDIKHRSKTNPFTGTWLSEGPNNIGGRINCVAVHPVNDNIIYAGSVYGGIFKTTDAGQTWTPIFDSTAYLSVGSIAIDQTDPQIIYAGTGDPSTSGSSFTGNGIYKSTDGGTTWINKGLRETGVVAKITIDPSDHNILYAAAMGFLMRRNEHKGLYKSTDGGTTWDKVLYIDDETGAMDVIVDPVYPLIVYATTMRRIRTEKESVVFGNTTAIHRSTDGGATWNQLTNGLPPGPWCKVNIELHPTQHTTLFASVVNSDLQLAGIYRSTNSGQNWGALNTEDIDSTALGGFGWYFGEIRVNPFNTDELFLQGVDLWKSTDGGNSWELGAPEWYQYIVHADKHFMHFYSASRYLLACDGGVYETKNSGTSWSKLSNMPITQFYHVKVNYWQDGIYYGGAQDQGTSKGNAGTAGSWQRVLGGDGFRTAFSTTDPELIWASVQNGNIYYSTESGLNFSSAVLGVDQDDRKNWDSPYLLSKHNTTAFVGTQYIYKADDYRFPFFVKTSPDLTDGNIYGEQFHNMSVVFQNELNAQHVYAGTSDGNVWSSINEGNTWENITGILPERYVTAMAGSFNDPQLIYVTHSGYKSDDRIPHIHRSLNNGSTWTDISSNLPSFAINDVLTFSKNDSIIAVATDGGIYITTDAGALWSRMGNNMPVFPVYDIEYDTINYKLIAGTYARSMMSYDMKSFFGITIGMATVKKLEREMKVYPVPAVNEVTVELPISVPVEAITVYNLKGEMVYVAAEDWYKRRIDLSAWGKGVYLIAVKVSGYLIVKKMVKY